MAPGLADMASIVPHQGGWEAAIYFRGMKRKFWLGQCTKAQATAFARHLENLKTAAEIGMDPGRDTRLWLNNLGPRLKSKLIEFGFLHQSSEWPAEIEAFCDKYLESRDDWQPNTVKRMKNVRNKLVDYFPDKRLAEVTAGEAERFARLIRTKYKAKSHSGKIIADARAYFAAAVKERLIVENPFTGIDSSQPHNRDREYYISEEVADKLIASAQPEFAAVIASARYGGLRIPSEAITLHWNDIAGRIVHVWDQKRKTTRDVPLFAKWAAALEKWKAEGNAAGPVFIAARSSANKTYRKYLLQLLEDQKIAPWPKLWQNMRASRETDLKRQFPGEHHLVHRWIGNTGTVSAKHYDRVPDDAIERAIQ